VPVSAAASHAISDTQRFGYAPSLMVWMAGYAERSLRTKNHADLAIENRSKECELSQLDADADGEQRKEILTWGGPNIDQCAGKTDAMQKATMRVSLG
jgi:hypothetical protein